MRAGRPSKGSEHVEKLTGSDEAKDRLKAVVATFTGEMTVAEACAHLGVSDARFHQIRDEVLANALSNLEPKPCGRPRQEESAEAARVRELEARVKRLELEVDAGYVRTMIALTMPKLLRDDWAVRKDGEHGGKKK